MSRSRKNRRKQKQESAGTESISSLPPPASHVWTKRWLVHGGILLFALLLRFYFVQHVEWFARSDTRDFHEYALNLLRGEGFVNYWNEAPVRDGFVSRQVHSVGYPLFLAGVYRVAGFDADTYARGYMANMRLGAHALPAQGFNPTHALVANILLDLITMLALVFIAVRLFGWRTAAVVQLLFALYVTWTPQLISETLFICLFVSALALIIANPDFKNPWLAAAFGVVNTLAVMTKPMAIILYAFVGFWVLRKLSFSRIRTAILIGIPLVIFVFAMFWRSHHYYGHFFLSSTGAQHVVTANYGYSWWDEHVRLWEQLGRPANEWEWMNHFRQLKREADREDPLRAARIYVQSIGQMFSLAPDWHMDWLWEANYRARPDVAANHRTLFSLSLIWYFLGPLGLFLFWRKAWIPATTILFFFLLHAAVSPGHHRYMAPVNVLFLLFSGAFLTWMCAQFVRLVKESATENA